MDEYERLLEELAKDGIFLDDTPLPHCDGLYREMPDSVYINVNGALPLRQRFTALAHEIGHYHTMSAIGTHGQIEHRANKYAVHRLVPWTKLIDAISIGYESVHELADFFRVDERFMRQALHIYGLSI